MKSHTKTAIIGLGIMILIFIAGKLMLKNAKKTNPVNTSVSIDSIGVISADKIGYKLVSSIQLSQIKPKGIDICPDGKIIVSGDSTFLKLDSKGKEILRINNTKSGNCVAVSSDNLIYLGAGNHIEIYNTDGLLLNSWEPVSDSSVLTSISVYKNQLAVADAYLKKVYFYNINGKLLQTIGTSDSKEEFSRFIIPSFYFDLAFDASGELWV